MLFPGTGCLSKNSETEKNKLFLEWEKNQPIRISSRTTNTFRAINGTRKIPDEDIHDILCK
jgi:hypothetical protein